MSALWLAEPPAGAGVTFAADRGFERPFRSDVLDDRLAELDELLGATQPMTFAAWPKADPARVPKPLRDLPGGDAFAELLEPEAPAMTFGRRRRVRELYRRVRDFLARLRDGLFGFHRVLLEEPALRVTVVTALDSDVDVGPDGAAVTDDMVEHIERGLAAALDGLRDALSVFTKVVQIVAAVVRAASNPALAVRALWRALNALYDLLVKHFAADAA
jgi:hypothetical protein